MEEKITLSRGRRELVIAVLSSMPIYIITALKIHKQLIQEIDKARRKFLWDRAMRSMEAKARWTRKGSAGQSSMVDLEYLICKKTGHAPWLRCLWYERTSPNKPWIGTPTPWMNKIRSSLLPPPRSSWGTAERHSFGNQPRPRAPPPPKNNCLKSIQALKKEEANSGRGPRRR